MTFGSADRRPLAAWIAPAEAARSIDLQTASAGFCSACPPSARPKRLLQWRGTAAESPFETM